MNRDPMKMALSTDIVLDIVLSHLNLKDLLDCRYVSKFWNKAASSVLRKRSTMIQNISKTNTLKKLEECLKQSWDFPFAGLIVDQPWKLSSAVAMEFFKNYGARFTRLRLDTLLREARLEDQAPFIMDLPSLSILELDCPSSSLSPELLDSAAGQKDARNLNLPSLRTLRIFCSGFTEGLFREVCTAASPSLRIECLCATYENLRLLKGAGKLQAVSVIEVPPDANEKDNALRVDSLLSTESPALTKLDFNVNGCISRKGLIRLLISSQHTLKQLRLVEIYPCQFVPKCPVLAKLTTLNLSMSDKYDFPYESIFQGRRGHKFPALKELTLDMDVHPSITVRISDGLFIVPSLRKIEIGGYVKKSGIEALARSFPNVIEVQLRHQYHDFQWARHTDITDIWSVGAFKLLEKLVIWPYTIQSPTKMVENFKKHQGPIDLKIFRMMNMDSFLTGIPIGICENLRKRPRQKLKDSPFNEILRDSPNLLQLKNLRELIVCVRLDDELKWKKLPEEPPFASMVSVRYALKMMPKLTAKFVYEHRVPAWSSGEEDRKKTVRMLKAAFKHVNRCIKLEPFFY